MKRANIEFLIGFPDALRRDDRNAVRSMLDPEIVWRGLRPDLVRRNADEVIAILAENRDQYYTEIERIELIGAEHHAILHAAGGDVTQVADIPLPDGIYNLHGIEDGVVRSIEDFNERAAAYAAAGLETR
jgi:hypothetical protein